MTDTSTEAVERLAARIESPDIEPIYATRFNNKTITEESAATLRALAAERDHAADRIEALVKELDDVTINRAAWELEAKMQQAEVARFEEMSMLDFANYQTAKSLRRIQSMKGDKP
jgi:hypothetical protein